MAADDEAQLIEGIYDAALDPSVLADVISRMRARLGASISVMFAFDADVSGLWNLHGVDQRVFEHYAEHYHQLDVFKYGLIAHGLLRSGTVFIDEQIVDAPTLRRSPFVNELLRPNDFGPMCGSPVHVAPEGTVAQLSFYRPVGAEEFGQRETAFLERMVPHLGRAARLRFRLERRARPPAWTLELLDTLPWGVVLLNAKQWPVCVNREAERILHQADGLRLDRCGLYAQHPEDAQRLRQVLASAVAKPGHGPGPGADAQVRRPSGARPLLLTVVPVGRHLLDRIGAGSVRAVVNIFDPANRPVTPAERLRAYFGLTPAEAGLAQALAAGRTLHEYAEEAQVTCETARWRLKQVLAKTDTHRQAELVRLLLTTSVLG